MIWIFVTLSFKVFALQLGCHDNCFEGPSGAGIVQRVKLRCALPSFVSFYIL